MLETKDKVLIVDDMASMRNIIHALLSELGYTDLHMQNNGKNALSWVKANMPDLIVTDWNMPEMDGITFLKHLKGDGATKDIPVLMVTAERKREQVIEAAQVGASGYVCKPFDAATLQAKLEAIYAKKQK